MNTEETLAQISAKLDELLELSRPRRRARVAHPGTAGFRPQQLLRAMAKAEMTSPEAAAPVKALVMESGISQRTIYAVLNRLSERGLVTSERDEEVLEGTLTKMRQRVWYLTEAGAAEASSTLEL